jgi:hypothetical protein
VISTSEETCVSRCCGYCQQSFQPTKYRPDQSVCSEANCQRRRRADYHRQKIATDQEYAQVVRDSRKKWRDEHPDYQKNYWRTHGEAAERNRQQQRRRDRQRRVQNLVKNNSALDLKRSAAEVWLLGPGSSHLEKNNLASCRLFIFQSLAPAPMPSPGS